MTPTQTTIPLLSAYAQDSYALYRQIAPGSVYQLRRSACIYEAWAKRSGHARFTADTITGESLSEFLRDVTRLYSQAYLRKIRGDLLTLMRAAADDGLCTFPRKVRTIPKPKPRPRAWTREQVEKIVAAALDYSGSSSIVPHVGKYFAAIVLTAWDTGLRKEDLHSIKLAMVRDNGVITIVQSKTGDEHYCRVSEPTLAALRALRRAEPLAWPGGDDQFYYHWKRIVRLAGVEHLGGMHALRKSGATDVARNQPGAETRFLGHASSVADVHYIDRSLSADCAVMPTPLASLTPRKA